MGYFTASVDGVRRCCYRNIKVHLVAMAAGMTKINGFSPIPIAEDARIGKIAAPVTVLLVISVRKTMISITTSNRNKIDSFSSPLTANYVFFDSWFARSGLLRQISELVPVVSMLKRHPNILYKHGKRIYKLEKIKSISLSLQQ